MRNGKKIYIFSIRISPMTFCNIGGDGNYSPAYLIDQSKFFLIWETFRHLINLLYK